MTIEAFMLTCPERLQVRMDTLAGLRKSDWGYDRRVTVVHDQAKGPVSLKRIYDNYRTMVKQAAASRHDWVLLLEDDLEFPGDFYQRLTSVMSGLDALGDDAFVSLYDSGQPGFFGGQAILAKRKTIGYCWLHDADEVSLHYDIKLPRLAAKVCRPFQLNVVEHVGRSTWGGPKHGRAVLSDYKDDPEIYGR